MDLLLQAAAVALPPVESAAMQPSAPIVEPPRPQSTPPKKAAKPADSPKVGVLVFF